MTKAQARAYQARWRLVNAHEIEVLRTTPIDVKLKQFNTLFRWAQQLYATDDLRRREAEVCVVRERWVRLRKIYAGRRHKAQS